jgi:hypothetical protein
MCEEAIYKVKCVKCGAICGYIYPSDAVSKNDDCGCFEACVDICKCQEDK